MMASNIYGSTQVSNWVQSNLEIVAENSGTKGQWTPLQMQIAANMLLDKFNSGNIHLNMREVLLFFYRWIGGQFGHFYGSTDIQLIGQAADAFLEYRHEEICRIEREQEESQRTQKHDEMIRKSATPDERKEALIKGLRENPKSKDLLLSLGLITEEDIKVAGIIKEETEEVDNLRKAHEEEFRRRYMH